MRCSPRALAWVAWLLCASAAPIHARQLAFTISDLEAGEFSAQRIRARLSGARLQTLTLEIGRLSLGGRTWRKAALACPEVQLTGERIACASAILDIGTKTRLAFSFSTSTRELRVEAKPAADEAWHLLGRFGSTPVQLDVRLDRLRLERLSSWLPHGMPKITAGRANGTVILDGGALNARLDVDGVAFADASGLHAGEKVGASLEANASRAGQEWRWNARLAWRSGEVFWQPFYVTAKGHRLQVSGTTSPRVTTVRDGRLDVPGVATAAFNARWDSVQRELATVELSAERVQLGRLYEDILKPVAQGTALSDMRADGEIDFNLTADRGTLTAVDLQMHRVSLEDRQGRFALHGLDGRVPWRKDGLAKTELEIKALEFLKVSAGPMRVPLTLRGSRLDVETVRLPFLDGAITLRDFAAGRAQEGWRWRFSGDVTPISMSRLTQAFGLPVMHGSLSGSIPDVRYRRGVVSADGALTMHVFDGTATAANLSLIEPFGRAPRLHSDVTLNNIDLELLTRTFDFGTITGRIDARIGGLELVGWQPVRFDARFSSSPGSYPRKISQRAVQNLSALGGGGAAAALQRSFLRFFEQFGYEKLGLSCRLENGVCEMDGIESTPSGYVIVKGGGMPAITVIGYNRSVDWRELVERLRRVTQGNIKPVVK